MKSHFHFVTDDIRRENIEIVFNHIVDLTTLLNSPKYRRDKIFISSFRKTIIINTASIIEALLLEKLYTEFGEKVPLKTYWKYSNIEILHKISSKMEIIAGKRKKVQDKKKLQKLNFIEINQKCKSLKILNDSLFKDIEEVRKLRNRLHIWGLKKIDKEYNKKDLEFVFSVAAKVKNLFS